MSDFYVKKTAVHEETVRMGSRDSMGMNLGELRAAVRAAEGLNDNSQVTFEDLTRTLYEGEYWAKRIKITERSQEA